MAQPMFNNKPGFMLTDGEIETLYHLVLVRVNQIDEVMQLIQNTDINNIVIDKKLHLSMSNLSDLVRDDVDFIAREVNRLKLASKIRLTTNEN